VLRPAPKKQENPGRQEKGRQEKVGRVEIKRATQIIQEVIQEPAVLGEEEALHNKEILESAMAGVPGADGRAVEAIVGVLEHLGVEIEEMDLRQAYL